MTRKTTVFLTLLALISSGFSYGIFAQSKANIKNININKAKLKSEELNSYPAKQKAVHHVKRETGGRVLDVKQRSSDSGKVWRVKFLKDGKIQYMDVAPQTSTD